MAEKDGFLALLVGEYNAFSRKRKRSSPSFEWLLKSTEQFLAGFVFVTSNLGDLKIGQWPCPN